MRKIVVVENLTLDGVIQAPGRADEDVRGGFAHGGWATPYNDAVKFQIMAGGMAEAGPMLFGRRTYEDFYKVWHNRTDNPFTAVLDNAQKYVATTTAIEPLPWENSTRLVGDVGDAVAGLKAQPGKDFVVLGSGELVRSLVRRDLIDEFVLMIHPLVLGSGRRLFDDDGTLARLQLVDVKPTTTGVMVATYRRAEPSA